MSSGKAFIFKDPSENWRPPIFMFPLIFLIIFERPQIKKNIFLIENNLTV